MARRPVNCVPVSLDPYGRTVATCSVAGRDLAEWLVRNGLALDWPQYSKGKYHEAQREAERTGQGLWKGSYVRAVALSCMHPRKWKAVRLFGRCKCPSLMRSQPGANPQRALANHRTWAGGSSAVWATHATHHSQSPHCTMGMKWLQPPELPASGCALEVDGRLKAKFTARDGARAGGEELKKRFPMLQIRIYDAQRRARKSRSLHSSISGLLSLAACTMTRPLDLF